MTANAGPGRTPSSDGDRCLRVPLKAGESVGHWRLGRRHEERFDVADEPMAGGMDPAFFVTSNKNYIPHEYPCRREFAVQHRGRRPVPKSGFEPAEWWVSFEGGGVDLSGFWFRPTLIGGWATTRIEAGGPQTARFCFSTCGGAILSVNSREVVFLSRYQRNLDESIEVDVSLNAGTNAISVWFGDLCERDTRYLFDLTLLAGSDLHVCLPVGGDPDAAREIVRLLRGARFERPSFTAGEMVLVFPAAERPCTVRVECAGEHPEDARPPRRFRLNAGERQLVIGGVSDFPADFNRFTVTLEAEGFSLSRPLSVETCDLSRVPTPPGTLAARAGEALVQIAENCRPDPVRALARLALGQTGPATDAMLASSLPAINDCHDCADFALVPMLWCRTAFADQIGRGTIEAIEKAVLGFRYWMDEPGNDVMWFFSENHALLFHTAAYLAGTLFPAATFVRSGRTGAEQRAVGRTRLLGWFDSFERDEMAEWNSAPYFPIDFKGLAALAALAPDADIRDRAERAIARLLEIVALSSHQGMLTASQGRSYEHSLRPTRTIEISAIARLFFGRGSLGSTVHALPLLALLVRDHGFRVDPRLSELAAWQGDDSMEWTFRQGPGGLAALYHYKTRDYAMGTIACYRPGEWGYQETVLHLRLGDRPEAQVWINHPGERIISGSARPSYWGGCGTLPRLHQYRALAVVDFELKPGQVDFTHAWLPVAEFDAVVFREDRILVRAGNALALIVGNASHERVEEGPSAGCEIRLAGNRTRWLVRLSDIRTEGTLERFSERFSALAAVDAAEGEICLDDPDYGRVVCTEDGLVSAEGRVLDPSSWTRSGRAVRLPKGETVVLPSQES